MQPNSFVKLYLKQERHYINNVKALMLDIREWGEGVVKEVGYIVTSMPNSPSTFDETITYYLPEKNDYILVEFDGEMSDHRREQFNSWIKADSRGVIDTERIVWEGEESKEEEIEIKYTIDFELNGTNGQVPKLLKALKLIVGVENAFYSCLTTKMDYYKRMYKVTVRVSKKRLDNDIFENPEYPLEQILGTAIKIIKLYDLEVESYEVIDQKGEKVERYSYNVYPFIDHDKRDDGYIEILRESISKNGMVYDCSEVHYFNPNVPQESYFAITTNLGVTKKEFLEEFYKQGFVKKIKHNYEDVKLDFKMVELYFKSGEIDYFEFQNLISYLTNNVKVEKYVVPLLKNIDGDVYISENNSIRVIFKKDTYQSHIDDWRKYIFRNFEFVQGCCAVPIPKTKEITLPGRAVKVYLEYFKNEHLKNAQNRKLIKNNEFVQKVSSIQKGPYSSGFYYLVTLKDGVDLDKAISSLDELDFVKYISWDMKSDPYEEIFGIQLSKKTSPLYNKDGSLNVNNLGTESLLDATLSNKFTVTIPDIHNHKEREVVIETPKGKIVVKHVKENLYIYRGGKLIWSDDEIFTYP